jgi:HEAT repeat protein
VTDFWLYRFSRHPQYLGWIIWSYGVLFLPGANMKRYVDVANTLPWLLATMVIIGVAMLEERKMKQEYGETYESYRQRTSFLFPLPRIVRQIFSLPLRLFFRKAYPNRKREIAAVVAFYTALCILLSAFATGIIGFSKEETFSEQKVEQLIHTIKTSPHRGDIRHAAASLAAIGGTAVDSLIGLLHHEKMLVRWYCADALGTVRSEKVVQPLAALLNDTDHTVRRTAASSLGGTGSSTAVPILIDAFQDSQKGVESYAARALGRLRAEEAVPVLIEGLQREQSAIVRACAWALGEIGDKQAIEPLIICLERQEDWHYFMVGEALQKLGSERATDAYIAGMENGVWWVQDSCATALGDMKTEKGLFPLIQALRHEEARLRRAAVLALSKYPPQQTEAALREALADDDWEVRMYAEAALKRIGD